MEGSWLETFKFAPALPDSNGRLRGAKTRSPWYLEMPASPSTCLLASALLVRPCEQKLKSQRGLQSRGVPCSNSNHHHMTAPRGLCVYVRALRGPTQRLPAPIASPEGLQLFCLQCLLFRNLECLSSSVTMLQTLTLTLPHASHLDSIYMTQRRAMGAGQQADVCICAGHAASGCSCRV